MIYIPHSCKVFQICTTHYFNLYALVEGNFMLHNRRSTCHKGGSLLIRCDHQLWDFHLCRLKDFGSFCLSKSHPGAGFSSSSLYKLIFFDLYSNLGASNCPSSVLYNFELKMGILKCRIHLLMSLKCYLNFWFCSEPENRI